MPPRGNQPQERVCEANWRRSLCAAKRDPRLRGCTPLRTPKRRSEVSAAKRTQYYCPFLTPPSLPPLLSRVFPRTPDAFNGCCSRDGLCFKSLLCRGGIYAARSLPRQPVNGKRGGLPPSLTPLVRKFSQQSVGAGHARPAALLCHPFAFCLVGRGLDPSAAFRRRPVTALPPNPLLTPLS